MVEAKSFAGVSGAVALGVGFVALAQSGVLDALNTYRVLDYSITQLIFMAIIVAIPAFIAVEVVLGIRKPQDFLKATSEAMAQVAGTTPEKAEQFMKDIAYKAVNIVKTATGTPVKQYTSPLELRRKLQQNFASVRQASVLPVTGGLVGQYSPLVVVTGYPLSLANAERQTDQVRRRNIIGFVILVAMVAFYLITTWLKGA